jgi:hypothetical protein
MTPRAFAEIASQIAAESGLKADVLDEDRLAGLEMGLLLGVARGSAERPRLVVLRYEPARPATAAVLGLVGKGVTFDTGGISIKPSDRMHLMKADMSGGAAVVAAMKAIAALKPDVTVVGVVPLVENMPGGRAMRPGDVVRTAAFTVTGLLAGVLADRYSRRTIVAVAVTVEETKLQIARPETEAAYIPVDVPLAGSEGPDIRNVHIRLTARQAVAYRRLRSGLVSLGERLDDGRMVDDTIRGQPLQWFLERLADAK